MPSPQVLEVHFPNEEASTEWRRSSQAVSNLYMNGTKFWTKSDLRDIEQQLSESKTLEHFTLHTVDGRTIIIKNRVFGEEASIWAPQVEYQDYWRLVNRQPVCPPELFYCSYLIHWTNTSVKKSWGLMENRKLSFETNVHAWKRSSSCRLLELHLENILATRKVTKIICLGLGDFCRKEPPGSMALGNSHLSKEELGAAMIRSRIVQHAIAMTMVKTCERLYGKAVQLLAQDPDYTEEAKTILQAYGFSIVGESGAGGFAEIDDHSGVFSAFISAPLKQIIADIGRPPLVISTSAIVMDGHLPHDPESPRTIEMWQEYSIHKFPVCEENIELLFSVGTLCLYVNEVLKS